MKHLISIADLTSTDIQGLIDDALAMKGGGSKPLLQGKVLALLFEKPSLRTRVSFDVAMHQLGGHALYLSPAEVGLGQREPAADVARVLSRYVDGIAARTFAHESVVSLAEHSSVPVINALSDGEHPCQALADLLTIRESKGGLGGVVVAYIGDGGNNVAASLLLACSLMGIEVRIAFPQGYGPADDIIARTQKGGKVSLMQEPEQAAAGADVVYTDVWASMGQEGEAEARRKAFAGYQVDRELLSVAKGDAIFMHPLPAHQGEEIAEGLLELPCSAVFDQAENRLHMQKAILARLLR